MAKKTLGSLLSSDWWRKTFKKESSSEPQLWWSQLADVQNSEDLCVVDSYCYKKKSVKSEKNPFNLIKMRLLPIVKGTLQKFKSRKSEDPTTPNEQADGFHTTPAGEFPRNGPKSSIVAIVMFYLSKIITIIGLILVARAVWFEEVINLLILILIFSGTFTMIHLDTNLQMPRI